MQNKVFKDLLETSRGLRPAEFVLKNGQVLNVFTGEFENKDVAISAGKIVGVGEYDGIKELDVTDKFIVPGFIDSHMHIESSMVTPRNFVGMILPHGTTTLIADPHEIVNVLGQKGMDFMLAETDNMPANIFFNLPSCVPSTPFETSGATFSASEMERFLTHPRVLGLGEVMDSIGTINGDQDKLDKIHLFKNKFRNAVVDGHAPRLSGKDLQAYRLAGVSSDHECSSFEECVEKLRSGMWIQIREGSAAKNLESIVRGIKESNIDTERCLLCTDDESIEDIRRRGHINFCVKKAISLGMEPVKALKMATINAATCYGLRYLGAIAAGYQADILVLDDLVEVEVTKVFHKGKLISENKKEVVVNTIENKFDLTASVNLPELSKESFKIQPKDAKNIPIIELVPHEITTKYAVESLELEGDEFVPYGDYLKFAVIERHNGTGNIGLGILKGFGFKNGAIASTVAHDSHNLLVAGDNDNDILAACKELERCGGGFTVVSEGEVMGTLPFAVGGIMSTEKPTQVQDKLAKMMDIAHGQGVPETADPFVTLSFMALPVIPEIKVTDKGLFDAVKFEFIDWLK